MIYLFTLMLTSSAAFSVYLHYIGAIINPLVFVLIGWLPAVVAYYLSNLWDLLRIFTLNRSYEAYIVNGQGDFWNGLTFTDQGKPKLFYNNFQVDHELKMLHGKFDDAVELYVRVILPEKLFRSINNNDDDNLDEGDDNE